MAWNFNPAEYEANEFAVIPEGDHRVRINDVVSKRFKSGNDGYEITLEVSGYGSKLWYHLVLDPNDSKKTNQRIGSFFDSFGITDYNMDHFSAWAGKVGAVRVVHEAYNGNQKAKVRFCLSRKNQDRLPPAKFSSAAATNAAPAGGYAPITAEDDELPFE